MVLILKDPRLYIDYGKGQEEIGDGYNLGPGNYFSNIPNPSTNKYNEIDMKKKTQDMARLSVRAAARFE